MPDIGHTPLQERLQASGETDKARPDLHEVPDNPPVDQEDLDRGTEKLERVIAK